MHLRILCAAGCSILFIASASQSSFGVTVFDNGLTNTVTGSLSGVRVENGTTVRFVSGSSSIGQPGSRDDGVAVSQDSAVIVEGGEIRGASASPSETISGLGVVAINSVVDVRSGLVAGGSTAGGFGSVAILTFLESRVEISGGVIRAGEDTDGNLRGGADAVLINPGSELVVTGGRIESIAGRGATVLPNSIANISGGEFVGGDGGFSGQSALFLRGAEFEISGGRFVSGTSPGGLSEPPVEVFGGDGRISGGRFETGGTRSLEMFASSEAFDVTIEGGAWPGGSEWFLSSSLPSGESVLTVRGTNLSFTGSRLVGTLLDGEPIDVVIQNRDRVPVRLVPEPSAAAALLAGLVSLISLRTGR